MSSPRPSHDPDQPRAAEPLSAAQQAGIDGYRADQDRTLAAMHALEAALASAAPGRDATWRDEVGAQLAILDQSAEDEYRNAETPDSLLSDIARTQPRLRNRVRGLRLGTRQLRDRTRALHAELADTANNIDVDDIRRRLGALLTAVRNQRARESDLIYEAYFEAFHRDLDEPGSVR